MSKVGHIRAFVLDDVNTLIIYVLKSMQLLKICARLLQTKAYDITLEFHTFVEILKHTHL